MQVNSQMEFRLKSEVKCCGTGINAIRLLWSLFINESVINILISIRVNDTAYAMLALCRAQWSYFLKNKVALVIFF